MYVQGLAQGTDDAKLAGMFARFGAIQSAHVQRGDSESDLRANGYVSFKESDSAAAAVKEMNKSRTAEGDFLIVNQHISKRENELAKGTKNAPITN